MERNSHDTVGLVESKLHSVSVVNIDVDVKDTRMISTPDNISCSMQKWKRKSCEPEELKDGEDDIIDITEATCLTPFGVMQATRPVDSDVSRSGA